MVGAKDPGDLLAGYRQGRISLWKVKVNNGQVAKFCLEGRYGGSEHGFRFRAADGVDSGDDMARHVDDSF